MPRLCRVRVLIPIIALAGWMAWLSTAWYQRSQAAAPLPTIADEIVRLHLEAKARHDDFIHRQSATRQAARTEYTRRYHMDPPPGYDIWYEYSVRHGAPVIDDYDGLMADIQPFRSYFASRCDLADTAQPDPAVFRMCIKDGKVVDGGAQDDYAKKNFLQPFQDMVADFVNQIGDLCLDFNTYNESRIVLPNIRDLNLQPVGKPSDNNCVVQEFRPLEKRSIWDDAIKSCPANAPARSGKPWTGVELTPFNALVRNWQEEADLCLQSEAPPSGLIHGPEKMLLGHAAKPIFSPGRLSTFSDIRYPSLLRHVHDEHEGHPDIFIFEVKRHTLGWRGDSTGGTTSHPDDFWRFQRHRMVSMAQGRVTGTVGRVEMDERGLVKPTPQLRKRLDIGFTRLVGCANNATCEAMRSQFRVVAGMTQLQIWANKIVLDMDGNGLSGRFYQFMRGNSAIMRQTLVQEWHDGRLVPWLHYIPLSMNMMELPDMLEFLLEKGDPITAAIAKNGREWANAALRPDDQKVYVFRMLLELARRDYTTI